MKLPNRKSEKSLFYFAPQLNIPGGDKSKGNSR